MDRYLEKWASGSTPLDYSPHGAPRQEPRPPKDFPDPKKVSEERDRNRQFARYRKRGFTRRDIKRTREIVGERDE
ncbi:MAG TPA: hypothetical protein VG934_01200 [Candidatus Paceibacterota bacterium]|nr:hypothetical protein [Candidatus Paceibacterota bacterium]